MPLFQNKEKEKKAKTEAPNTLTPPVEELEENGLQALEPEEPEKEVILNVMEIPIEYFEELQPLIQDVNITDVEFSSGDIWTIDISNTVRKRDDIHMTERQIRTLAERINISKASDFNNVNAVLETEAVTSTGENLRIEVLHHEYAQDGTELYIRKTPAITPIVTLPGMLPSITSLTVVSESDAVIARTARLITRSRIMFIADSLSMVFRSEASLM